MITLLLVGTAVMLPAVQGKVEKPLVFGAGRGPRPTSWQCVAEGSDKVVACRNALDYLWWLDQHNYSMG